MTTSNQTTPTPSSGFRVKMGPHGRVVIPVAIRKQIGLATGDELMLEADDRGVRLRTLAQLVADAQDYFTSDLPQGPLVSEALIQDRRAEAARE